MGVNVGPYFVAASLWDFGLAKSFRYFDWVWGHDNFAAPPNDLNDEEQVAFHHYSQAIWLCSLGYWCFRWNVNMYDIGRKMAPAVPAFPGKLTQREEASDELSRVCETFGLQLVEFVPNGRSRFAPAEGWGRPAAM